MIDVLLKSFCNIICAFLIVICGREALDTPNILYCILWWFGVYFMLELHVRLINYLEENL